MSTSFAIDAKPYADMQLIDQQDLFEKTSMKVTTDPTLPFTNLGACMRSDIVFVEGDEQTPPLIGTVLVDTSQLFYSACLIFDGGDPRVADVIDQGLWKDKVDQFPCTEKMPEDFSIAEPYSPIYTFIAGNDGDSHPHPALYLAIQPEEIENGPLKELPLAVAMATYDLATPVMYMETKGDPANGDVRLTLSMSFSYLANPLPAIALPTPDYIEKMSLHALSDTNAFEPSFGDPSYKGQYSKITFDM